MEEFFRDFHFLRPWYLLLLFLPLLFYWKFFSRCQKQVFLGGRLRQTVA